MTILHPKFDHNRQNIQQHSQYILIVLIWQALYNKLINLHECYPSVMLMVVVVGVAHDDGFYCAQHA